MNQQTKNVRDFLEEIVLLGKARGLSLSHEDTQGSFEVESYDPKIERWLLEATDLTANLVKRS